ncbi:MAG: tRNA 2-thiocytidine(32) synthetase TtcA [Rhodomicrobiaceae bacterium]
MSETAAPEPKETEQLANEKQSAPASSIAHPLFQNTPSSVEFTKLRKRLIKQMRQAIDDFDMLGLNAKPIDGTKPSASKKWLVCVSGGKDSYGLISLLHDLKWRGLLPVELIAMNLDQKQPGFPSHILPEFFKQYDIPNHIETQDTYTIVTDKVPANKTYCSLCSRLRRGIIYTVAKKLGCDTVVLGHHREDILETFLLNLFFGAKLSAMPPKLLNEEGTLNLIRPLSYVAENDLSKFSNYMNFPIIPCDLCGSQDGLQRQQMKKLLTSWEEQRPGTKEMMLKSLGNIRPSQLLDQKLFDFSDLSPKLPENS